MQRSRVRNMVDMPARARAPWSSRPLASGKITSRTAHAGVPGLAQESSSAAVLKLMARRPAEITVASIQARVDSSLLTMSTTDSAPFVVPDRSSVDGRVMAIPQSHLENAALQCHHHGVGAVL